MGETALVGRDPDPALRVDRDGVDSIRRNAICIGRIVFENHENAAVRPGQVQSAPVCPEPDIALCIFGNCTDTVTTDSPGYPRAMRKLQNQTGRGLQYIDPASMRPEPYVAAPGFEHRHDPAATGATRITDLDGNGFQPSVRRILF